MGTGDVGALCFGVVVGWITYRTLVRRAGPASMSDIATVIGAIGGGAVVGIFKDKVLFAWYSIGLAIGFFVYLIIFAALNGTRTTAQVMGDGEGSVKINQLSGMTTWA